MAKYTPETYFLNPSHESIARSRYYLKNDKGECVEKNIFETFKRVNEYVFQNDPNHKELAQRLCEEKKFMYAGRPLAQAGTGIKNMFNCYSKDAPVVTERGVLPISSINIGDRVLTEDGTFQRVVNKFSQGYREKLIRVKVERMPNVLDVTPDHKILTRRGWVPAEELTSADYVSVPGYRDKQVVPEYINILDYISPSSIGEGWVLEEVDGFIYRLNDKETSVFDNKYSAKVSPVRSKIKVSSDLAKLLGYYISEGCAASSGNTVLFTYHEDEKEYINETKDLVEELFGVSAHINNIKGQKCTQVQVNSKIINNFFKNWIGPSFDNKILPWWVLNTSLDFQRLVLAYACRGDGHVEETGQALLTMCNPHTMMQMFFIAQKLGLAYSLKYNKKKEEHHATPVALRIAHDRAQAGEFIEFAALVERFVHDNRYWRRVASIEEIDYNDNVWDISVEVNHSLQIAGMVGSNCFVLGIEDSREAISECQRIHFHIQAHGGGTGINFSKLRPSGAWCKGANARSSGPEGFITAMSYLSSNISQGGNRCLPGYTRIAMADGSWKNLDQMRSGDLIIAFDKTTRSFVPTEVVNFFENGVQDIYEYVLAGGQVVRSTDTHRWLGQQTDGTLVASTVKDMPETSKKIGVIKGLAGEGINFHTIKETRNLGPDLTYCIEINHPDHLFVADGAISHNSGANMGILEDWHPGLLSFITKKSRGNWENVRRFAVITNENLFKQWQWVNPYAWQTFNVSVALSDDFMRQVKSKSDKPWHLKWKDKVWKLWDYKAVLHDYTPSGDIIDDPILLTVVAPDEEIAWHEAANQLPFRNVSSSGLSLVKGPYELTALQWFERICRNAWEDGCPGIFFIDRARAYHNGEYFNPVDATNPCYAGDQRLLTAGGFKTFRELYHGGQAVELVQDSRVFYTGPEVDNNNPLHWEVRSSERGFVTNTARPVRLTRKQAPIVKVTTNDGLEIRCTPDHHLATLNRGLVEAGHLLPSDKLLVADTPIITGIKKQSLDYKIGFLYGLFLGDGHLNTSNTSDKVIISLWGKDREELPYITGLIDRVYEELGGDITEGKNNRKLVPYFISEVSERNEIRITSTYLKRLFEYFGVLSSEDKYSFTPGKFEAREFYAGLFSGLVFTDGTIGYNKKNRNLSIRICSSNRNLLRQLQEEALLYGALGRIYQRRGSRSTPLPDGRGGKKKYVSRPSYELIFAGIHRDRLFDKLTLLGSKGIRYTELRSQIKQVYGTFWSRVAAVVPDGVEDVYCLAEDNRRTVVVNGITGRRCAEQILPQWSVCCLASVVLPEFVNDDGSIDWDSLKETVYLGVRALNHITLLNETGVAKIDENTKKERRIGLGTIGMHELLIRVGLRTGEDVRYSSDGGRALADKVEQFIQHSAYEASIEMAKEIGPFPAFVYDEFVKSKFMQELLKERPDLREPLKRHGIANVTILTQAPTGTTGTITGYSSGCEPYFAMAYVRNSNVGTILDGCPSFIEWLQDKGIDFAEHAYSLKELRQHKRIPKIFEEAQDISWEDHLKMQAVFSKRVDSSVSKTINLPNRATSKDIMEAYIQAYDMGIKSTTVYRDGSKVQILETMQGAVRNKEECRPKTVVTLPAPKRPDKLDCDIHTVSVKGMRWKVLVGLLHGRPYETFCFPEDQIEIPSSKTRGILTKTGSGGKYQLEISYGDDSIIIKDVASLLLTDEHRMLTRLLSISLRHGAPLNAISSQLSKCDGEVTAFSKALMRVLRKYISDEDYLATAACQQCGSKNLVLQEGCLKCNQCGFSGCN